MVFLNFPWLGTYKYELRARNWKMTTGYISGNHLLLDTIFSLFSNIIEFSLWIRSMRARTAENTKSTTRSAINTLIMEFCFLCEFILICRGLIKVCPCDSLRITISHLFQSWLFIHPGWIDPVPSGGGKLLSLKPRYSSNSPSLKRGIQLYKWQTVWGTLNASIGEGMFSPFLCRFVSCTKKFVEFSKNGS